MAILELIFEIFVEVLGYFILNFIGSLIIWIFRAKGLSFVKIFKKDENTLFGFILLFIVFAVITFITMCW